MLKGTPLTWWLLTGERRQYVIDKIKKPIMKALTILANRYPEPTKENCMVLNTRKLIDIRDKFFEYEDNPDRDALFRAIWKLFIIEYEHDRYYQYRINWVLEQIMECDWYPRRKRVERCWKEPVEPEVLEEWAETEKVLKAADSQRDRDFGENREKQQECCGLSY